MNRSISTVDLFCGAGGLTHGFEQAGIPVNAGYDIDLACKFPYEHNNPAKFILQDVENLSGSDLAEHFSGISIKVLVGCAPCQPFSSYARRYDKSVNSKWKLLQDFARIVKQCEPDIISMENVLHLKNHAIFQEFISQLKALKYYVNSHEVNCLNYGIPQSRKRLVLLASKFGKINLIPPTHNPNNYQTVRQTIENLESLSAGQFSQVDRLHKCSKLSELNLRRIRASKPGGTWRDWSQDLIAECHLKSSGKTYPAVYGRMEWDKPSPTITTQCFGFGNGRFGHPEQDRAISLREAALLQTFPRTYQFVPSDRPVVFDVVGRLIGNAVPVKLGMVIARSILEHIK
ncbi:MULTISPECIES: DNA cytosine methyltransferase [unclassified Roseofilum]|uniref:DNA cytosine methyltransferase n=1 Tax=unclassified Roseofilum TaxID=2620099 RepID=UPI000E8B9354|nr:MULTISPECIES: DNA cytosine methyltransferase [unclassified Roseofilum]MBP0008170.1 DNA cytosine methyltransferase [Roseofilum sp. Belize Diploria]MBP0032670.1 DNA cytosine methyltransferase [Roseofilum sp. Belize BBD 4]HBQ99187.1 DNA (cytosine-5-)-methyltransferase [Cyanobacteria bacterium UBA11691]